MKNLEASSITKVTIYKTEKGKKKKEKKARWPRQKKLQRKKEDKIKFYFVLLFGHVIEKVP